MRSKNKGPQSFADGVSRNDDMSAAPSNSPEVGFIKPVTGHAPAGNEVCHMPHSPVWQDWGIKHMKLGWAGQQGSIGDSGQFNLWPFPVLPDLEVLREICKGNLSLKGSII